LINMVAQGARKIWLRCRQSPTHAVVTALPDRLGAKNEGV